VGTKRRRTKQEIEEAKEEDTLRNQRVDEKLAEIALLKE